MMELQRVVIDGRPAMVGEPMPGVIKVVFDDGEVLFGTSAVQKFNPNHDEQGRFASGQGNGSEGGGAAAAGEHPTGGLGSGEGSRSGATGVAAAQAKADAAAGNEQALAGLPTKPMILDGEAFVPGPNARAREAARAYMEKAGLAYDPPQAYVPVDPERAGRIADAFEQMKHDPNDPAVRASYDAMIDETLAQWDTIKDTGLKVEFIEPGQEDPYSSPRAAIEDMRDNNHMWVYSTAAGFGTEDANRADSPMLRRTGETINGHPALVNDIFRTVHDYFGHFKEGVGFRASGEDNAWRSHAAMYSEKARPAMTTETRGQNSWVNFGPFGAANRTANGENTHYAPQKIGLLPSFAFQKISKT